MLEINLIKYKNWRIIYDNMKTRFNKLLFYRRRFKQTLEPMLVVRIIIFKNEKWKLETQNNNRKAVFEQ